MGARKGGGASDAGRADGASDIGIRGRRDRRQHIRARLSKGGAGSESSPIAETVRRASGV